VEEVMANAGPAGFWLEPPKPFDKILLLHFHHDPKGRECGNLTANMPTGAALAMGLQSWPAWFLLAIPRSIAFRGCNRSLNSPITTGPWYGPTAARPRRPPSSRFMASWRQR